MASISRSYGCCKNENVENEPIIDCIKCKKSHHYACLAMTLDLDSVMAENWYCPTCIQLIPKPQKGDSTAVHTPSTSRRTKRPALQSPDAASAALTRDDVRDIVKEVLQAELGASVKQINSHTVSVVNKQLESITQGLKEIQDSMNFMNTRFEEIELEQSTAKTVMHDLREENSKMKTITKGLSNRLNYLEQHSRSNNLEIQCVPEDKKENLYTVVEKLGQAIGCQVAETNIMHCTRIAKMNTESSRPRSVVVQLASPRLRDEILAATIKFNKANPQDKLNSTHLGASGPKSPVFVVEHLSPANKNLHASARRIAKNKGYKYVWIRSGKIFVRKNDNSEYIYISSQDSLNKIK